MREPTAGPVGGPVDGPASEPVTPVDPARPTGAARTPFSARRLRAMLPGIVLNWLVPVLVYGLLRSHVSSDLLALVISAAIPVVVTAVTFLVRRKVSVFGVIAIAGFAISLAISALTGGSELAFKLQDPALTGTVGLILLLSAAIGKPLYLVIVRVVARYSPAAGQPAAKHLDRKRGTILSALIGGTFFLHGLAITILALTVPTSTFLALSRPVGLPILAVGVAIMFWYGRRSAARHSSVSVSGPTKSA